MFGLAERLAKGRKNRLTRLAAAIESLAGSDAKQLRLAKEMDALRPVGAQMLHATCRIFVHSVNRHLKAPEVTLDPGEWPEAGYCNGSLNLIQINVRGRLLQIQFGPTEQAVSTEDFQRPYTLEGSVRSFNQDLLDKNRIDEQQIYFCPKRETGQWYFVDRRSYRTGLFDEDYLVRELGRLV